MRHTLFMRRMLAQNNTSYLRNTLSSNHLNTLNTIHLLVAAKMWAFSGLSSAIVCPYFPEERRTPKKPCPKAIPSRAITAPFSDQAPAQVRLLASEKQPTSKTLRPQLPVGYCGRYGLQERQISPQNKSKSSKKHLSEPTLCVHSCAFLGKYEHLWDYQ